MKTARNFGMSKKQFRAWLVKHGDDPQGCTSCGALAGCCAEYPHCPGNREWRTSPDEVPDAHD